MANDNLKDLSQVSPLVQELIHEAPASVISIAPPTPLPKVVSNYIGASKAYWEGKSQELYSRYVYGQQLAKFGNNRRDFQVFYSRLSDAIIESIKNECKTKGKSTEDLACYFTMISSIMSLIGKEVKTKEPTGQSINILACLHGFLEQYNNEIEKDI